LRARELLTSEADVDRYHEVLDSWWGEILD
jgi:hypothetical protein